MDEMFPRGALERLIFGFCLIGAELSDRRPGSSVFFLARDIAALLVGDWCRSPLHSVPGRRASM